MSRRAVHRLSPATALVLLVVSAVPGAGQDDGAIRGRVIDAEGRAPISSAEVVLVTGMSLADAETHSTDALRTLGRVRVSVTGDDGLYRFDGLRPGEYVLRIDRIGYARATLAVQLDGGRSGEVSVVLEVRPIALAPLEVGTDGDAVSVLRGLGIAPEGRIPAIRYRQAETLASDAWVVTPADVEGSGSMVELDIFRAMQRLPSVTSRDDWSAELWTRGAPWGETRVFLDGIPLFNPVHGFGVFSGLTYQGMGPALFHPGARVPRHPESGAAVVELTSRSAVGTATTRGGADLSLGGGHAWARAPLQGGAGGVSVAARRSYVDLVAEAAAADFPYAFWDALGRIDLALPFGRLEASGLVEADDVTGEIEDVLHGTTASWGNYAGQVTLHVRPRGVSTRVGLGGTEYWSGVRSIESVADSFYNAPREPPANHRVGYLTAYAAFEDDARRWRGGVDATVQRASYIGPLPLPYSDHGFELDRPRVDQTRSLRRLGAWGAWRSRPLDALEVDLGLRVGTGTDTGRDPLALQPTVMLRWRFDQETTLSVGGGRYIQYAQTPAAVGPDLFGPLRAGRYWTLAGPDAPALDTRLVSVGAERWLSESWLLSTTAYARDSDGNLLPDPRSGFLVDRSPWWSGRTEARGVELGVRKLAGRITGSASYSLSRTRAEVGGIRFDAPTDRRHAVDVTTSVSLGGRRMLNVAFTHQTGTPYARTTADCLVANCTRVGLFLHQPFERRGPAYRSLDLMYSSTFRIRGAGITWYVQARNILGHDNAVTYYRTSHTCPNQNYVDDGCAGGLPFQPVDEFLVGVPRAPALGLRVQF